MADPIAEVPPLLQPYVRDVRLDAVVLTSGVSGTDRGAAVGVALAVLGPLAAIGVGRLGWALAGAAGAVFGSAAVYALGFLLIAVAIVFTRDPQIAVTLGPHRLRIGVDGSERVVPWAEITDVRASARGFYVWLSDGGRVHVPPLRGGAEDTGALIALLSERAAQARVGCDEVPEALDDLRRTRRRLSRPADPPGRTRS